MMAALKFLHLAGLIYWCAALLALPLLMRALGGTQDQIHYARFRLITHIAYILIATPAALIAIAAGTGLIFAAQVFAPWLLVKLAFVAALVLIHVWLGHLIQRSGEERRSHWVMGPMVALALLLPVIGMILLLVLTKPDLSPVREMIPDQFLVPRGEAS